ncbi:23S rRNA (uracil(1939)-C(5))-methyltransferase RlmD [Mycoplasmopsis arginini]|uniref:23S rRNA (uracil(1939)-C(5))-methyltransferase RlmD n=1 Tax=Mycoplasmopsis arginini TaxID=2094 RepID=UPI0002D180A8|nr:23S rRNA (uracil(1939)-C(5))-methyltransferase RlmD [Mycoplasmopsis arginini]ENY69654.1 tRNA (uracil-5-)-methyltransferase related enzyme [Mycoplasmopsis arginini 7264]MDI3348748.1 23S rRNA (uracil(1939)-C(5))-methyltransferase RlmD [Mycoplasmopsis arginini]BAQ54471.1 tRNA (uracil-5-)-methyltransferase related enzyme [Mycoplasmopsis arginini]
MAANKRELELKEGLVIKRVKNEASAFYLGLSYEGLCVLRDFNIPVFVYNLLPNEEADIQITYYSKKCCFAKVIKYRNFSPLRECLDNNKKLLYETGSAPLMSLSYDNQLKFKQFIINSLFERNLSYSNVLPIVKSVCQWGYRNKITLQVKYENEKPLLGFFKKYSHDLVQQEELFFGVVSIRNFYKSFLLNPESDFEKKINEIIFKFKPHKITLRSPKSTFRNIEIILQINDEPKEEFVKELEKLNLQETKYKFSIFNKNNKTWTNLLNHAGNKHEIGKLTFNVKNDTFYQINENVMNLIYKQIYDWIPTCKLTNILDSFGGVGTIGLFVASKANTVYTIEINEISTQMAKQNIKENKIDNVIAINADANKWLVDNYKIVDMVIFDPPREGLGKEAISSIIKSKIKRVIYLSCEPKTLVRDLKELINNGYGIKEVQPYDMFPQTHHIETLVLLQKKEI